MKRAGLTDAEPDLREIKRKYPEVWIRERRITLAHNRTVTVRWIVHLIVLLGIAVAVNYK